MSGLNPMSRAARIRSVAGPALAVATVLSMAGCQDPVSTAGRGVEFSQAAGAEPVWVHGSFFMDAIVHVDCLGEDARFHGEVPFRTHTVESASGNLNVHFQLLPAARSPLFLLEGVTSGKVYVFQGGPYNEILHVAAGEVFRFKTNETYVSADGDRVEASAMLHVTVNANGEVTAEKSEPFANKCIDK